MFRFMFLWFFAILTASAFGQEKFVIRKDLADQWQQFENGALLPVDDDHNANLKSVHFTVNASQFPGHNLLVKSVKPFFLFINGKLVRKHTGPLSLSLDSLAAVTYTPAMQVTVFQYRINPKDLKTQIISFRETRAEYISTLKPRAYFKDFVIVAGTILIIFFVVMMRMHPKLAADYFSITRVLSLREAEDNQSHARFAISSNVLFYIFSSMLLGLCLIILLNNLPDTYLLPLAFKSHSFGGALLQWLKLSSIILIILFGKILLVFSLSNLFGMKGIAGIHFFNWVRLLLIVAGSLSAILFIYFISRGHDTQIYVIMLSIIVAARVGWIGIVFLKLNNRIEHSMFHLFSYICATEVIPLLITIKVLFH
jgi:hypothetical protein